MAMGHGTLPSEPQVIIVLDVHPTETARFGWRNLAFRKELRKGWFGGVILEILEVLYICRTPFLSTYGVVVM